MFMYALQRRLERTQVKVFSLHNGTIDTMVKKQPDDLATWGSIYSVGRQLGKPLISIKLTLLAVFQTAHFKRQLKGR